ncbi:hypothetical protein [Enterococcus hirae]|uniref:hypothetical protein n=1 Tax=Enterococcus hirae TaxID=1354 RepID=UPI00136F2BAC|nr:hypothetical protein [Enterococcus hirae]NAE18063.1 hypothetical protein [Enterococcus hirae]
MARRAEQRQLRELDQVAHYRQLWTGRVFWGSVVVVSVTGAALVAVLGDLYARHQSLPGFLKELLGPGLAAAVIGLLTVAGLVVRSIPHLGVLMRMVGQAEHRTSSLEEKVTQTATVKDAAALQELILGIGDQLRRQDDALRRQDLVLQELAERDHSGRHEAAPTPPPPSWQSLPAGSHASQQRLPPEQPPLSEEPEVEPGRGHRSWGMERPKTGEFDAIIQWRPDGSDDPSLPEYLRGR